MVKIGSGTIEILMTLTLCCCGGGLKLFSCSLVEVELGLWQNNLNLLVSSPGLLQTFSINFTWLAIFALQSIDKNTDCRSRLLFLQGCFSSSKRILHSSIVTSYPPKISAAPYVVILTTFHTFQVDIAQRRSIFLSIKSFLTWINLSPF